MPIQVKMAELEESCEYHLVPTPKTTCWDEEVELCPKVPELEDREQDLYKCTHRVGDDRCQGVRLTITREICHAVEKYHPYPPRPYSVRKIY